MQESILTRARKEYPIGTLFYSSTGLLKSPMKVTSLRMSNVSKGVAVNSEGGELYMIMTVKRGQRSVHQKAEEEKELVLDYWNDYKQFDDGLVIFLSAKKLANYEFYEIYHKHVYTSNNPWSEDILKK